MRLVSIRWRCAFMAGLIGGVLGLASHSAWADSYPSRPIRLVVGFTPGGPSDLLARVVGEALHERLNQPVVIENRPGAGGNIAAKAVAEDEGDGYTLLMGNNSILATNVSLYKDPGFNPIKDFLPVTLIGSQANILVVHPSVPVHSVGELIALAKTEPGKLNFASSGYGAAAHLAGELFKKQAGVDIVHIAFKGAAPALTDLMGGQVQMMFATAASVTPYIKNGMLRPLAVTTSNRSSFAPELPTMAESGLPGFEATTWHGIVVPASTPPAIVEMLHRAIVEALHQPDVQKKLNGLEVEIIGNSPEEFSAYINAEIPKWATVIKQSGAKIE